MAGEPAARSRATGPTASPVGFGAGRSGLLDGRVKGLPWHASLPSTGLGAQGWNVLRGDLPTPVMVLRETAVEHNLVVMADWCREHAVSLAPHGKTTMAPALVDRQFEHGAWAVTAATTTQALVFVEAGAPVVLLANQVVDPAGLDWVARIVRTGTRLLVLVDSVAGTRLLASALEGSAAVLEVLLEVGTPDGRCGVRTNQQAHAVAEAVAASGQLRLAGVETFEGVLHGDDVQHTARRVDGLLHRVVDVARDLDRAGHFADLDEVVLTAGGSTWFDRVVEAFTDAGLSRPVRTVVRSGGYLTHDVGRNHTLSPLDGRGGAGTRLRPALEVWASVLSRPEDGLAVLNMGKRDVPFDVSLPVPQHVSTPGSGVRALTPGAVTVAALYDQHTVVRLAAREPLAVGDLVGSGIDHPCTAFDKWRLVPVVDDDYTVIDGVETWF